MKKNVTLDEYQKKAVETPGNILLIAGAGAGKTFTITKKIDYLINNAGFGGQGEFIKRSMEQDMSMIAVNIETPTRLTKLFLPDFVKRGRYAWPTSSRLLRY
jgi:short-subunit dehydrogenase